MPEEDCTRAKANEEREEERVCLQRTAILAVLANESDLTADEIWERLPESVRLNQVRFKSILTSENGQLWIRSGKGGKGGGYTYSPLAGGG